MKKLLFIALALSFTFSVAKADGRDKVITKEQLPSAAQQLIASHFSGLKILLVSEDREFVSRNYEVLFEDGTKLEFTRDGEWSACSIDSRRD